MIMLYLDLLVAYMRVLFLFENISDRTGIISLYCAASFLTGSQATNKYQIDLKALLDATSDLHRHWIDLFQPHQTVFQLLLLEFQESMQVALDSDQLRKSGALNPINEGSVMGMPTFRPVSI